MFLTKKGLRQILLVAVCYLVLGSFCIGMGVLLTGIGSDSKLLFILGGISYVLCCLFTLTGFYVEGTGKIVNLGNRLLRIELKPAEFIKEYHRLACSSDLVINKPDIDVLQLVVLAYDCLNDRENALSTADKILAVVSEKKRTHAKLIKSSLLFDYGMTEEAEALFTEACSSKQNFICQALANAILKSDRAMAMGDYKTVELHNLNLLAQTFPKLDNLSKLSIHFRLGEVYEKTNDNEKAINHYQYCIDNSGETAFKESAKAALSRIQ